jgi:hypothetical protein
MFLSDPQYQATTVKSLKDLVLIAASAMQRSDPLSGLKSMSAVFAFVEDENQYYAFDPDSLVAPDVSIFYPYGRNVVFARSALQVDPVLVPGATVVGDANKVGRWFVYGEMNATLVADSPPFPLAPAFINLFPDLPVGVNRTGGADVKVEFSAQWDAGPNGAAPGSTLGFFVTVDGVVYANAEAAVSTTIVGQLGTTSIASVVNLPEGLHQVNVRAAQIGAIGAFVRALNGHANLTVEILGA